MVYRNFVFYGFVICVLLSIVTCPHPGEDENDENIFSGPNNGVEMDNLVGSSSCDLGITGAAGSGASVEVSALMESSKVDRINRTLTEYANGLLREWNIAGKEVKVFRTLDDENINIKVRIKLERPNVLSIEFASDFGYVFSNFRATEKIQEVVVLIMVYRFAKQNDKFRNFGPVAYQVCHISGAVLFMLGVCLAFCNHFGVAQVVVKVGLGCIGVSGVLGIGMILSVCIYEGCCNRQKEQVVRDAVRNIIRANNDTIGLEALKCWTDVPYRLSIDYLTAHLGIEDLSVSRH